MSDLTEVTRHECALSVLMAGDMTEDGRLRCGHGFVLSPGDKIATRRGEVYTVGEAERAQSSGSIQHTLAAYRP